VALLVAGAVVGILLEVQVDAKENDLTRNKNLAFSPQNAAIGFFSRIVLVFLLINQVLFYSNAAKDIGTGYIKIMLIFAGISLSLFGGGYVMIPIMEVLFVKELHWLNNKEFIDAIAFSQATPGPILISATFIGYKIAGFGGALLATAAIFAPSVFLVILVSNIISKYQEKRFIKNLLGGIKVVVVGLIVVSAFQIIQHENFNWWLTGLLLISFILNYKYKISPVYLVLAAVLLGIFTNLL